MAIKAPVQPYKSPTLRKIKPPTPGLPQSPGFPQEPVAEPPGPITTQDELVKYIATLGSQPYKPPPQGLAPNLQQAPGPQVKPPVNVPPAVQQPASQTPPAAQPSGTPPVASPPPQPAAAARGGVIARRAGTSDLAVQLPLDGKYRFYFNQNGNKLWAIGPKGEIYVPQVDKMYQDPQSGRVTVTVNGQNFLADTDVRQGEYLNEEGDPVDMSKYPSGKEIQTNQYGRVINTDSNLSSNILQQVENARRGLGPGREGGLPVPEEGLPNVAKAQAFQSGKGEKDGALSQAEKQVSDYDDQIAENEAKQATAKDDAEKARLKAESALLKRQRDVAEATRKNLQDQAEATRKAEEKKLKDAAELAEKAQDKVEKKEAATAKARLGLRAEFKSQDLEAKLAKLKADPAFSLKPELQQQAQVLQRSISVLKSAIARGEVPVDIAPEAEQVSQKLGLHYNPETGETSFIDTDGQPSFDTVPFFYDVTNDKWLVEYKGKWYPAEEGEAQAALPATAQPTGASGRQQAPLSSAQSIPNFFSMLGQRLQAALQAGQRSEVESLLKMQAALDRRLP